MNTRLGKSFGLAFVVAVGILAVMFALGTFNAQKAAADKPNSAGVHPSFQNDATTADDALQADIDLKAAQFAAYRAGIEAGDVTASPAVPGLEFSSRAAGAAVAITITAEDPADDIGVGDEIKVRLNGFGVPSSISGDHVFLRQSPTVSAVAANVTVNGTVLTIEVDNTGLDTSPTGLSGAYEIRIRQAAGITNPATAGVYHVELDDVDNTTSFGGDAATHHVRIDRSRKLSAGSGVSGSSLTISGTGYNAGISAIFIENTTVEDTNATPWDGVSGITYRPVGISREAFLASLELDRGTTATDDDAASLPDAFLATIGIGVLDGNGMVPDADKPTAKTVYQIVFRSGLGTPSGTPFEYWQYTPLDDDAGTVEGVVQLATPSQDFEDEVLAAEPSLTGGKFSQTVTVGNEFDAGPNPVFVEDLTGAVEFVGNYAVRPSITLSKTAAQLGDRFDITFNHFILTTGELVDLSPTIGGVELEQPLGEGPPVINGDAPNNTATYVVPSETLDPGVHQVKVEAYREDGDKREIGTGDLSVGGLPLEIKPAVAVPGQTIVIKGSGFTGGGTIATIHIGRTAITGGVKVLAYNVTRDDDPGEDDYGVLDGTDRIEQVTAIRISQNGNWTASIKIPETVASVGNSVQVVAREGSGGTFGSNRSAVQDITIPKPSLELDPPSGRPGSTMTITGAGWTAESTVLIYYDAKIVTSINAHTDGSFVQQTVVPIEADVGVDNIELTGEMARPRTGGWAIKTATVLHAVPPGVLSVSPAGGPPGASIIVSGEGFKAFTPFSVSIGGREVLSEASENTDDMGNFSRTVVVPPLREGIHSITVSQQGRGQSRNTDTIPFTVGDIGPATRDSEVAFADLIAANNLIVVWLFDNDTKAWSFYDPRPEVAPAVDLKQVTSGDIVWIQVGTNQDFPGATPSDLTAGWNQVTIN